MKVQVITRHAVTNYGSILQAIATQKIIEKCNFDCEIIDYQREDEHYNRIENTLLKQKQGWNNNLVKKMIYLLMRKPSSIIAGKKFERMQKEYLNLTPRYNSAKELQESISEADYYMTGSDQVWGKLACGEYDTSYFLDFVKDDAKKLAFAASFGHAVKTEEEQKMFEYNLKKYSKIAVREDSAVKHLEDMGIVAQQVLDPTLLIAADEWRQMIKKEMPKKYVLVYQIHNDKRVGKYAKAFAEKAGLPLIRISPFFHQIFREGKLHYLPDISEFLSYINNAEYLITDSFHGTAFAINLNTDFIEILPNTNTGSRNQSILKLTGLTDRIVTDMNDFSLLDKKIKFDDVNSIIENERKKSLKILKLFLNDNEEG